MWCGVVWCGVKLSGMNTYERIFGAGPRGFLLSLALLALAWQLESVAGLPSITASYLARWLVFVLTVVGAVFVVVWSLNQIREVKATAIVSHPFRGNHSYPPSKVRSLRAPKIETGASDRVCYVS